MLLVLSTFNVTVHLGTPRWVVGRAVAIYQAGVFGGLALGAWLWGVAAERRPKRRSDGLWQPTVERNSAP